MAQAATDSLDEVVVTASRTEQALTQTLSHTTVINRKDIETSQAVDVPALLRGLAGVEVPQRGSIGRFSGGVSMRGTNPSQVLVLVDGVRINSAPTGMTQIDHFMLDQVERIEVVRGNISSLYGSDAMGGVIQIFTRRGKGAPAFNGSFGAGSYKARRASAGFGGEVESTSFNVQLSRYKSDGVSAVKASLVPSVNPDKDGYDNKSASVNVRHNFGSAHSLAASLFDSKATSQNDGFGLKTDVNSSQAQLRKYGVVSDNRLSDDWLSKLQWSRGLDDTRNYLNGAPDSVLGSKFKTTSDLLSWQHTLRVGGSNALVLGWEKLKQQVENDTAYTRTRRTDDSLFAGYTINFGTEQLQLNYRKDKYSDFGTAKTWLLGYGGNIAESWRLTANMATAFKAPTLNDLFYPYTDFGTWGTYQGNPNLKPEHSRNKELGLRYAKESERLDVVYFDNVIQDLIVNNYQFAGTMVNLSEARINGAELAYSEQVGDTLTKLSVTRQNPRDANTGQTLLRRAKNFANLGVVKQYGALKLGGEWQYSGARADIDINTLAPVRLSPYDVANLTASYTLDAHTELNARVGNLFNRDYMLAHGYNTLRRSVYVGLSYR